MKLATIKLATMKPATLRLATVRLFTVTVALATGGFPVADAQTPPETLENSAKLKLVKIPAGEFEMGFTGKEIATSLSQPVRKVKISKPFFLGTTEITKGQWKAVMGPPGAAAAPDDNLPQVTTWSSAVDFCKRLSDMPEEKKAGRVYRLPTEAEWEYACRAGTKTLYSFGDDWTQLENHGWFVNNSQNKPNPVAAKKPNAWGLHDMHGSMWEWCSDFFGKYDPAATTDPTGPAEGTERVIRGGSWKHSGGYSQSAARGSEAFPPAPGAGLDYVGLRIALTVPETPPAAPAAPAAPAGK